MAGQHFTEGLPDVSRETIDLVARLPETPRWSRLIRPEWVHQKVAVGFLGRYLSKGKQNREHAALARMPTGSGKTGIMAILSNYFSKLNIHNILIVAPSEFLTRQICDALNQDFWRAVNGRPPSGPKLSVTVVPSTLQEKVSEMHGKEAIYVCTTQTLFMLHANLARKETDADRKESWADAYLELRRLTNLVLVDEGHREPAREWAKAVRSFSLPTILFTATPYRNDLRFFRVGPEDEGFRYTFRFQQAVDSKVIRNVRFKDDESFGDNAKRFVEILVKFFYGGFKSMIPAGIRKPKVIIRCQDYESLKEVKRLLEAKLKEGKKDDTCLAVHDRFEKDDEKKQNFHDVPGKKNDDQRENPATFWVHQFKLTEGLDNPDFCLLAFFEPFPNARGLVQQIGRVLRNPKPHRANQKATVLSDRVHGLREQWDGYLSFEKSKRALVGPEEIVERFLKALPDWFYAGGRYRQAANFQSADFEDEMLWDDLLLRKSANIYRLPEPFGIKDFNSLLTTLSDALEDRDMVEVRTLPVKRDRGLLGAILSWRIVQTDSLSEGGFFNVAFVPSVLYAHKGFLFHSGPVGLGTVDEEDSLIRLTPSEMEKLLGSKPTIKQVSLINCDLGNASVRRKSLGARSIADVAPGLNDHFHYVSTAVGTFLDGEVQRRRYLGLSKGKVTEAEDAQIGIKRFQLWANELSEQLEKRRLKSSPVFARFARSVPAPPAARAAHLLLDLVDFFDVFEGRPDDIFPDTFEATACDVNPEGTFTCTVGDTPITGTVTYPGPKTSRRFVLQSSDLDDYFQLKNPEVGSKKQSAAAYFTHRGVMRIVTTELQLYADRHFYEPRVPLWGEGRMDNLELLFGIGQLERIKSEKGKEGIIGHNTWQDGSVFHLIDKGKTLYELGELNPQILVCEDLGPEYADFIAADLDHQRVALIHAKQCGSGLSASDLHIVNSQVIKNLEFLNPTGSVAPDRGRKWDQLWKWRTTDSDKKGLKRIRRSPAGVAVRGASIFKEIQELIRRPSTEKEVWVVLGGGFSISALKKQLEATPPYHVVHLAYLLQSCNANVSSVGAKLRIFTSP
jgi:hypothetical protein